MGKGNKKKRKFSASFNSDHFDSKNFQLNMLHSKKKFRKMNNFNYRRKSRFDGNVKRKFIHRPILSHHVESDVTQFLVPSYNLKNQPNGPQKIGPTVLRDDSKKCMDRHSANVKGSDVSSQKLSLPIYAVRNQLLQYLRKGLCTVVIGETGSGKTTQIPQFIYEEKMNKMGAICITQPRRVAAISIAKRVAQEMRCDVGDLVGYSVRFEEVYSGRTKLKYVTDGMLLRESLRDDMLSQYSWVVLDEAHERSVNTDILFGIIKNAQKKRNQVGKASLHILVMSATMDVDHFSKYFNDAKIIYIEGRQFPVEIHYLKEQNSDYTLACMSTVFEIHKKAPAGDGILVFLTGQEEIDSAVQTIKEIAKDSSMSSYPSLKVFPLYASLPTHRQINVFKEILPAERKVIVSTNIAETSITIPGIKYVIDCGRSKVRTFNSASGFDVLKVCKISQAQSWQRSGRAGRERPGVCYRVYTMEEFDSMKVDPIPEILRANLSSVTLQLYAMGITDVLNFDFMSKPSADNIKESENLLCMLKAIDMTTSARLTALGKSMASFPLAPCFSKVILTAANFGCLNEILILIALLSGESIYVNPTNKRKVAKEVRRKFASMEGDHLTLIKIYRAFKACKNKKSWCQSNFLNQRNLIYAGKVRKQLKQICDKLSIKRSSCGQATEPVLRCLISGLFTNIAELQVDGRYISLHSRHKVFIHPTSVLFGSKPPYILFTELIKTGKTYMHTNSSVDASWLVEESSEYFKTRHLRRVGV